MTETIAKTVSSLCGIIHFDGAPVDPEALRKMAQAAAYSGPEGTCYWLGQNAGFAYLALHVTPEARFERQPLCDPQSGAVWAADARLDNREELIDLLRKHGGLQGEGIVTDVELLMLAYRLWGTDFLPKIYGNYAFIMWDPARQQVLAGRDFLGLRPMFYMRHGETLYLASTMRSILAVLPERPPLNELLIADYYCYSFDRWVAETVYLPIRRLPAACLLSLDARHEDLRQHWMITNAPILHYKNDQEYYDQFLELFEQVLQSCARTANPLGVLVSGGVDSSSITCMLHKIWTEARLNSQASSVRLYKLNFFQDPSEDESQYYETVRRACPQFSSTVISGEECWGLKEIGNEQDYHLDEPEISIARCVQTAEFQTCRRDGCRVVLQGFGGDELFHYYFDDEELLSDLPASLWPPAVRSYSRRKGMLASSKLIGRWLLQRSGLRPVWTSLRDHVQHRLRGRRNAPAWLRAEWSKWNPASRPIFRLSIPDEFGSALQRIRQRQIFTSGFYLAMMEYNHHLAVENGLEIRYPFLDRRLTEFVFRLPTEKLLDFKLVLKPFLKAALSDILPGEISRRTHKSGITPTIQFGLRSKEKMKVQKLMEGAQQIQAKYIDFPAYQNAWSNFLAERSSLSRPLFMPLTLQAWMRDNGLA